MGKRFVIAGQKRHRIPRKGRGRMRASSRQMSRQSIFFERISCPLARTMDTRVKPAYDGLNVGSHLRLV
jgi:hypothetical protein